MTFDATVSLGNLIQIVLLVVAVLAAFFALRGNVKILEVQIASEVKHREALADRVQRLENQIESEIEKLGVKFDEGLRRIYDKLDEKADK